MSGHTDYDLARTILNADEELRRTIHEVFVAFGHIAQSLVDSGAAPPPLLRVDEVARWLAVSERAVRQQIEADRIPAVKVGKRWVVLRDVWLAELEEQLREERSRVARSRRRARRHP